MWKAEINAFTLIAAVLGATAARFSPDGGWTMAAVGLLFTLILFAFDRNGYRLMWQSVAFAGVTAYVFTIAAIGLLFLGHAFWPQYVSWPAPFFWQPVFWISASVVFTVIDRVRMESRAPRSIFSAVPATPVTPPVTHTPVTPVAVPAPTPKVAPVAPTPQPVALPPNAGKPATIYLNIVGGGISYLRSVSAEHLGRDYYRITESAPADEQWEFNAGQVVRCEKRKLSSGKALVAVQEAPRAQVNQ